MLIPAEQHAIPTYPQRPPRSSRNEREQSTRRGRGNGHGCAHGPGRDRSAEVFHPGSCASEAVLNCRLCLYTYAAGSAAEGYRSHVNAKMESGQTTKKTAFLNRPSVIRPTEGGERATLGLSIVSTRAFRLSITHLASSSIILNTAQNHPSKCHVDPSRHLHG
jgi:hypothetical protein